METGEPAFPLAGTYDRYGEDLKPRRVGMSLRDYFAAKAMQALIHRGVEGRYAESSVAIQAYGFADAMLAKRIGD